MSAAHELEIAKARAEEARQQLTGTMVDMQARLNPKTLALDAVQDLKEAGSEIARDGIAAVKRRPVATAGVVATLGLLLARRPIARLFARKNETASRKKR